MNQQRARRFRSAQEARENDEKKEELQKLLARQLTCDILQGKSLLVTGKWYNRLILNLSIRNLINLGLIVFYDLLKDPTGVGRVLYSESFEVCGRL